MTVSVRKLDVLKPFAEAVKYAQERVPMTRPDFDGLSSEAKMRAFTIAGVARRRTIEEAYERAVEAIEKGWTKEALGEEIRKLVADREGVLLSRGHSELIFQNHHNICVSAGRWKQMQETKGTRPYLRYPLVPNDDRLSDICRPLLGLVAHIDDPIWESIYPPNHHRDRHKKPTSLTEAQAKEAGIYEGDGQPYPFVDGRRIMPDPGFDSRPGLVTADDRALVEAANAIGAELPAKTAKDYGLPALKAVDVKTLAPAPNRWIDLEDFSDASIAEAWTHFQKEIGIPSDGTSVSVLDLFGEGVRVNRESFDRIIGTLRSEADQERKKDRVRFFSWILPTLEEPTEVWLVQRAGGKTHRRYVKLFRGDDEKAKPMLAIIDLSPDGWLMANVFRNSRWNNLERQRSGRLMFSALPREVGE